MDYQTILEKIFTAYPMYHKVGKTAYKEGLENIEALDRICGHPHKKYKTIHLAGTNGKGSVAHLLSSYCQEAGLKVGLYTSPHLFNFTERIKVCGVEISEAFIVDFFTQFQQEFDQLEPSFFEVTTMLAFYYFETQNVDIAIIETGLGGRLDSTNIIQPIVSIVTNISLDHTGMLGDSIEKIAFEKGGIIKNNTPVVIGEKEDCSWNVFHTIAQQRNAPIYSTDQYNVTFVEGKINIEKEGKLIYQNIPFPLMGDYQLKNVKTFLSAIDIIRKKLAISEDYLPAAIQNVLENTHFQGRWQTLNTNPLTICDVAHNPAGMEEVVKQLAKYQNHRIHFVIGFVNDKDTSALLSLLPKENVTYYLCKAKIARALEVDSLASLFSNNKLSYIACKTAADAYLEALKHAKNEDLVFIGGSCFVVGDLLEYLAQ